jgi:hypothetical protein
VDLVRTDFVLTFRTAKKNSEEYHNDNIKVAIAAHMRLCNLFSCDWVRVTSLILHVVLLPSHGIDRVRIKAGMTAMFH